MCLFVFNSIQKVKIILLIFTVFSRFSTGIILVSVETLYDRFLLPCFLKHDEVQFSEIIKVFCLLLNFVLKLLQILKDQVLPLIKRITRFHSCVVFLVNLVYKFFILLRHMLESQVLTRVDRFVQKQFFLQPFD